jgi:predicted RNase H-like nuclease (RuvC/YqgF family)
MNVIDKLIEKIKNNEIEKEELISYLQKVSWRIEGLEDTFERMEKLYKEEYKKNREIQDYAAELTYQTAKEYTLNVFNRMEVE